MCRPGQADPAPKVESAVVRLIPRPQEELLVRDAARFSALVAAAFAQRRKMLRNNLKGILDDAALLSCAFCRQRALKIFRSEIIFVLPIV